MSRLIVFWTTCLCFASYSISSGDGQNCKTNEVFKDCGSYCTPTCRTWEKQEEILCPDVCVDGCFCIDGFVKNDDGVCVSPDNCSSQKACKPDEQYYDCPYSCKYNCENYKNPGIRCRCDPPGCFCKEGLVKRKDGACVKYEDCNLS